MRSMIEVLGILFGVPTVVSLIQHAFNVRLDELLVMVVTYYRALLAPVYEVLHAPIAWFLAMFETPVPPWLRDAHTLSFIGASFGYRAIQKDPEPRTEGIWTWLASLLWGAMFLGLAFIGMLLFAMAFGRRTTNSDMHILFEAGWITTGAVAVFYLMNLLLLAGWVPGVAG